MVHHTGTLNYMDNIIYNLKLKTNKYNNYITIPSHVVINAVYFSVGRGDIVGVGQRASNFEIRHFVLQMGH